MTINASKEKISPSPYSAFEGVLVGRSKDTVILQVGNETRELNLLSIAAFWKQKDTLLDRFDVGDNVLVRVNKKTNVVVRAWSNLTRYRGKLTSEIKGGYSVRVESRSAKQSELEMLVTTETESINMATGKRMLGVTRLPNETYVDVIGLQTETGIIATKLSYVLPTDWANNSVKRNNELQANESFLPESQTSNAVSPQSCCPVTYYGHATWFNCGTGAGACGTCNTSNDSQLAWPQLGSGCSGCTYTCCDCSSGCANQTSLSCGNDVTIVSSCQGISRVASIVDCGPNQSSLCSYGCSGAPCGDNWSPPLVDLTKPTFATFYDPAYYGCFGVEAKVYNRCYPCPV